MTLINDDEYDDWEVDDTPTETHDVRGVCAALKDAWLIVPHLSFGDLLSVAIPTALNELSSQEIIETLEEFIHQNQ